MEQSIIDFNINKGFTNFGNTCFYNATLQSIFKCKDLIIALQNYNGTNRLLKYLKITIQDYYIKPNVETIGPVLLLRSYREMNSNYMGFSQEDGEECLRYFLDNFDMATKSEGINISSMFDCNLVSHLQCPKCNYESEMNVPEKLIFMSIISEDKSVVYKNFDEVLENFSAEETLTGDNQFICEKCNTIENKNITTSDNNVTTLDSPKTVIKVDAKKKLLIKGTPKYLFIGLKRFVHEWIKEHNKIKSSKINHDVQMPDTIPLNGFNYTMKGTIFHSGNLNGGHYVYFHKFGSTWTLIDDDDITPNETNEAITNKGYVYLYERD